MKFYSVTSECGDYYNPLHCHGVFFSREKAEARMAEVIEAYKPYKYESIEVNELDEGDEP